MLSSGLEDQKVGEKEIHTHSGQDTQGLGNSLVRPGEEIEQQIQCKKVYCQTEEGRYHELCPQREGWPGPPAFHLKGPQMVYKVILGSRYQETESTHRTRRKMEAVNKDKEEHQVGYGTQSSGNTEL